jgi:erythromycin esterase
VAPAPLDDSSAAALRWVDVHAVPLSSLDSGRAAPYGAALLAFVGNARVLGISELTEGTHEFPPIVRGILGVLAEGSGFRGLAIQAPMAEAMELDRYVRGGASDPRQWLRVLGPHWNTQEMLTVVEWIRAYNRGRAATDQIGFYGFELPTAGHAVQVVTSLPDSIAGAPLKSWLQRELRCVATGESAAWGRGGFASDSSFWNRCRVVAAAAAESLAALGGRQGSSRPSSELSFAEQMARLLEHHVDVGLRRLPRHEAVAEHVLWLANNLGSDGKLLVWGRDVESGRLTLEGNVVQSAVALAAKLGDRYRNLAYTFGEGSVRAKPIVPGKEPGDERDMRARPPRDGTYENVLNRARLDAFFLDLRTLSADTAGSWLKGPHPMRLISGVYTADALGAFETPIRFPENYDGVLFARRVTPALPLKR